jgi:hypothetical protein
MFFKTKKNHHPRSLQKGKDGKIHGELSHETSISGELLMIYIHGSHGNCGQNSPFFQWQPWCSHGEMPCIQRIGSAPWTAVFATGMEGQQVQGILDAAGAPSTDG